MGTDKMDFTQKSNFDFGVPGVPNLPVKQIVAESLHLSH